MPAAMEEWRSPAGSKDEAGSGSGAEGVGKGAGGVGEVATPPAATIISKRQRRPSVRLGEIGDQKSTASKAELGAGRWISPNFIPKRNNPGSLVKGNGKLPRTRPLANVSHRGEIGQGGELVKEAGSDEGEVAQMALEDVGKEEEAEATGPPSTSGRGNFENSMYGVRKGKHGKRKRAASIRSSTIAKTLGVVTLNRKAKELQKVASVNFVPPVSDAQNSEGQKEYAEVGATHMEMEEDSAAARVPESYEENGEEHPQNGDTEVLEEDGNGEDSSGRQEEDEPESPVVRDNQIVTMNGGAEVPQKFPLPKDDREQCTSRLTDGEKDRKQVFLNQVSMNGRRNGVRGWLSSLGLDKYGDLFEENEVDNEVLPLLTFDDLKEMGIVAVGARRKMFAAIQELGAGS